ncbi:MAG: shikimate kinase [Clostridia bacterium]|jgi:Shikimate kinase|nr:shikimate kinase [Clostridia bacterium]
MPDRHIFLIGMQGCGKSSLGKRVARETGLSFMDTDAMVAASAGCTVNEFFEKYGEETFRRAETGALSLLTREHPMIISTGGGTIMNPVNRHIMRAWGAIVLIDRPLEEILSDIKLDRRPTLRDGGLAEVERVYNERIGIYRDLADITVRNDQGYHMAVYTLTRLIRERF